MLRAANWARLLYIGWTGAELLVLLLTSPVKPMILVILGEEPQAKQSKGDLDIPPFVKRALMANAKSWENFLNLAPSHRRHYIQWIMDGKREETRERRLRQAVSRLEQSKGDPDDIPGFVKQA